MKITDKHKRALEITSKFEGATWGTVTGNTDGQILSVGILQWNVGQGTLYPLIIDSARTDRKKFDAVFGSHARSVLQAAKTKDKGYFALMLEGNGRQVRREWMEMWKRWGEEFKDAQIRGAEVYLQSAERLCQYLKLSSDRAFLWAFDFVVQAGGLGPASHTVSSHLSRLMEMGETERMYMVTMMRAATVRREFAFAFISRKLAIIYGAGWVNGEFVTLPSVDEKEEV